MFYAGFWHIHQEIDYFPPAGSQKILIVFSQLPEELFSSLNCGWSPNIRVEQFFFPIYPFFGPMSTFTCQYIVYIITFSNEAFIEFSQWWENCIYVLTKVNKKDKFPLKMQWSIQKGLKNDCQ